MRAHSTWRKAHSKGTEAREQSLSFSASVMGSGFIFGAALLEVSLQRGSRLYAPSLGAQKEDLMCAPGFGHAVVE